MPNLSFQIEGVNAAQFAAAPTLNFALRIQNASPSEAIHAILLRCQIQIEATHRRYDDGQQQRLFDLFGPPPEWARTLRRILWSQVSLSVPGFTANTAIGLPMPCTYDLNVAATKYFHALGSGDVPLRLLFSGTVFYAGDQGGWQVAQIPWDKEAMFHMPVRVWQEMMDCYYPHSAWLCLNREVLDRLIQYQRNAGLSTWDDVMESLLCGVGAARQMESGCGGQRPPCQEKVAP